ncbi:DUF4843 domain-containing protein [Aestuariibaculum suncheonense]|uniref:DUF4843 domain-containing protein n=1 Tax=Aestuariibaculum suncheonense TaxID=1028745 RepID=A0A8J6UC78_9FLAO|nr:DUF4843 domain-containing protein [Aestuariibaculum suncheonense]MBD0837013.1 DUF4843 domain-containing protein [Aestuariibaculum suncheonense]
MKKLIFNIITLGLVMAAVFSCDNDEFVYHEKDGVYFNVTDSVYYSFKGKTTSSDTLKIPVKIMGDVSDLDRSFKVMIDQENTTAEEGIHYKALDETYTFSANKFTEDLELVVYKDDPALLTEDRIIALKLLPTNDFNLGYTDKIELKVYITNQIIKPSYWDDFLDLYFGEYSKVKHNMAITVMGHDFPYLRSEAISVTAGYGYGYWQSQGRATVTYFIENEVYDENGNRIYPWSVF